MGTGDGLGESLTDGGDAPFAPRDYGREARFRGLIVAIFLQRLYSGP